MHLQTPNDIIGIRSKGRSNEDQTHDFHMHFGSKLLDLADMWYDLTVTTIHGGTALTLDKKSVKGLNRFFFAHYFLWTYPKNAKFLESQFKVCEEYAQGQRLWDCVAKIAALQAKKIEWLPQLDDLYTETFILTVDGTQQMARTYGCGNENIQPFQLIAELTIFCEGLKQKITPGKKVHTDRGYNSNLADKSRMISTPNTMDSNGLHNFKSHSRL
jgi:hypothetical protein